LLPLGQLLLFLYVSSFIGTTFWLFILISLAQRLAWVFAFSKTGFDFAKRFFTTFSVFVAVLFFYP